MPTQAEIDAAYAVIQRKVGWVKHSTVLEALRAAEQVRTTSMPSEREKALEARLAEAAKIITSFIEQEVDYMTINKLGDPEKQHNVKWGRAFLRGEYAPVTIGPSPATHAETLLAEAVGMLKRVPSALNGMFSAGIEEREGGSARRQERYAEAGDALQAEIPAFLAKLNGENDDK